ncbi:MAG TPA: nucleotide exchange factor GrpE [Clostridiaceae bacterium]|nr:nucleotide exchange factor GrpE [Clostridiaceae bacterium]
MAEEEKIIKDKKTTESEESAKSKKTAESKRATENKNTVKNEKTVEDKNTAEDKKKNASNDIADNAEQNAQEESIIDNDENKSNDEIDKLKKQLEEKENELNGYIDIAKRIKAEFENYKKRTLREKEQLYTDITGEIVSKFLPVIDNLERAAASDSEDVESMSKGLKMILKQFNDVLSKEGVEEIEAMGKEFDPNLHNAVMHTTDESVDEGVIVEVFQKGYKIKDKVIRHSVVKVAN